MKVLVDEMYPASIAEALCAINIEAATVADLRLAGASDPEVFGAAAIGGYTILTENVGDFARIAAEHSTAGEHHAGLLIALSSRFSRRPAGLQPLIAAIQAVADEHVEDRVIYLERVEQPVAPSCPLGGPDNMTTDLDLTNYTALSFDCYGTLIDWEAGIAAVLAPWAGEPGEWLLAPDALVKC